MPLGAADYTELVASTLEKIEGNLVDQVLTKHPTLDLFKQHAKSDTGRKLVLNIEAAEDSSTQFTDASGTFSTGVSGEIIGAAEYEWAAPLISKVRVVWKQLQMNQGKEQIVDLLKAHIEAAKKGHAKKVAQQLHVRAKDGVVSGLGTGTGPFFGFDHIISNYAYDANPDGNAATTTDAFTVGGIVAADANHFWNAQRLEVPRDHSTMGSGNIRKAFRYVKNEVAVATSDQAEITHVICGRDVFEEYADVFDGLVRVNPGDDSTAQGQFAEIKDGDLTLRLDPDAPAKRAYFLDMNTFRLRYLNGNWMKVQPAQQIVGTLDFVTPIASVLSIGCNQRRNNAVLLRPTTAGGDA